MPNSRFFGFPFINQNLSPPPNFRLQPKIKKLGSRLLLGLSKGFQNGMSQPHSTKTPKEDRIPRNGLLPDQGPGGGPLGFRSPIQQHDFYFVLTVKIWPKFNLPVKSCSIYADRQTHILHHCRRGQDFLHPHSFILFVKDKCFLKMGHTRPLFLYFRLFNTQLTENKCSI